ncbi:MAG: response regulator transcription factor [Betaproteobacteria bacterium]|nr:response regulator transcription factor [Betaproteobacteria bacterium]
MTRAANPVVHVVDDDEAFRDSLTWLLEGHGFEVRAHASATQFFAAGLPAPGSVILLDVRMPGMTGMQAHDELARRGAAAPIIFITGHGDVPMAVEAVKKGAFDFLEKPFQDERLIELIRRAATQGASRAPGGVRATGRLQALTQREREVLDRVVAGRLNKSIADDLGISIKTVEAHRAKVMEKMQAKSLAELIQIALAEKSG